MFVEAEKNCVHVALVYPDFTEDETTRQNLGNYSEGLASISAVLKKGGHKVSLIHLTYLPSKEQFLKRVEALDPDILGFSVRTTAYEDFAVMAKWLKDSGTKAFVFCGGYHPILVPDDCLKLEGVDGVCVGEGEWPLLKLCDHLAQTGEIDYTVESMHYKKASGEIIKNPVMPLIEDLDSLPFPDHELFDFDNLSASKMNTALIMVSRGCVFRCTYCGNSEFRSIYPNRNKYARFRSPERAVELIKWVIQKYPYIKFINFRDAILNMFPKWFEDFIVRYRDEIGLPFTCNLRFDILSEEHVRLLKQAGCYLIDVGLESGDEEIRRKYLERNMTDQNILDSCSWFKKHGIRCLTYNIIGLPHEDLEKALKTVKLNARADSDKQIPNIFYPYPMTKLAQIAIEAGYFDGNYGKQRVHLTMPDFPQSDILYIYRSFNHLVKKYRKIFSLPVEKAQRKEMRLDQKITGSYYPRAIIAWARGVWDKIYRTLRRTVLNVTPGLYRWLREKKNHLSSSKTTA